MTNARQFAVLYQWKIEKADEQALQDRWQATTVALHDEHGALGSCLLRDENGNFVALLAGRVRYI